MKSEKINLHPLNLHKFGYDFEQLTQTNSDLNQYVFTNEFQTQTIDFSNPDAVKSLNKSILMLN